MSTFFSPWFSLTEGLIGRHVTLAHGSCGGVHWRGRSPMRLCPRGLLWLLAGQHPGALSPCPPLHPHHARAAAHVLCSYYLLSRGATVVYSSIRKFKDDLTKYAPDFFVCVPLVLETLYAKVRRSASVEKQKEKREREREKKKPVRFMGCHRSTHDRINHHLPLKHIRCATHTPHTDVHMLACPPPPTSPSAPASSSPSFFPPRRCWPLLSVPAQSAASLQPPCWRQPSPPFGLAACLTVSP